MFIKKARRAARFLLCLFLLAGVISGTSVPISAAGTTKLPPGILIGDQEGIAVDGNGYYYIDARGLMPGDVIQKVVTIQNLDRSETPEAKYPYTITMMTEELFAKGPVDLLDKVQLVLKLDGAVIYEGRSRGDGTPNMTQQPLNLGTYNLGDRKTLDITLTVDADMEINKEKSETDFRWLFYAYRDVPSAPPKTGVLDKYGYFLPIGGVLLLLAILVPLKKRRDAQQ